MLGRQGVSPAVVGRIASGMWGTFDFRLARPGHSYRVTLRADGELDSFVYTVSPVESYRMVRQGDEFHASRIDTELVRRRARLAGIVTTSIYDAVADLGEEAQLASDFAAIFAWDLDFSRSVQRGDEFRLLYERTYASDGRGGEIYMGPGRILAASYRGGVGDLTAVYYETEPGRGGYYRPDGTSVQRRFLAAPLNYSRISSRYSNGRFHPILKVRRPHHGIDYAAPTGTPLWSVAHGTVIHKGWSRGFGRLVKIRHRNGYVSYYAHLSRYARGLQVGEAVQQKQVIGYVGQSGLATGPHVCFRMQKDGRYVNPASIQAPAGDPIPAQQLVGFETVRDELLARMGPASLVVTDEAL